MGNLDAVRPDIEGLPASAEIASHRHKAHLVGVDANCIDRSTAAAAIAFEADLPGVVAFGIGKIGRVRWRRRRIAAAERALAGWTCRDHDDSAIARQTAAIVHHFITADGCWLRRLIDMIVIIRDAGDQRPNPPRLFEKSEHRALVFSYRAARPAKAPRRACPQRSH